MTPELSRAGKLHSPSMARTSASSSSSAAESEPSAPAATAACVCVAVHARAPGLLSTGAGAAAARSSRKKADVSSVGSTHAGAAGVQLGAATAAAGEEEGPGAGRPVISCTMRWKLAGSAVMYVVCGRRDGRGLRLATRPPLGPPATARAAGGCAGLLDAGAGAASWPLDRSSEADADEVEEDGVDGEEKGRAAAELAWAGAMEARSAEVSAEFSKAAAEVRQPGGDEK